MEKNNELAAAIFRRVLGRLFLAGLLGWPGVCLAAPDAPSAAVAREEEGVRVSLKGGTQDQVSGLSLGVKQVSKGKYTDDAGAKRVGPMALLSLALEGQEKSRESAVREGQRLEIGGYRILVVKIVPGKLGLVNLLVRPPSKPAPSRAL